MKLEKKEKSAKKSKSAKKEKQGKKEKKTSRPRKASNASDENGDAMHRREQKLDIGDASDDAEESAPAAAATSTAVVPAKGGASVNDDKVVEEDEEAEKTTFEALGVCPALCEATARLGYKHPTDIQREAIPLALQGRDVIGLAKTGCGKTAAFGLPILQALLDNPIPYFALALAPTRELAVQIAEHFDAMGVDIGLKTVTLVGGIDMMSQAVALSKKPHIIVATPGRLLDHLENTKGFGLRNLKFLVFDEADKLLHMDFEEELDKILKIIPKERRTFLFSATMSTKVAKLQRASLTNPVKVEVSTKYSTADNLIQQYVFVPAKFKDCYLTYLLNEMGGNSVIVFTTTCNTTARLAFMLRNLGFPALPLHGQMSQAKRLGALNKFKEGTRAILLATDVASRGLDIPTVDLVINFDVPQHSKDYIHRVGRTARAGRSGRSVTVVSQYDVVMFQRIEELIGQKMDSFPTEEEEVLLLQERVSEAQRHAMNQMREIGMGQTSKRGTSSEDARPNKKRNFATSGYKGRKHRR